MRHLLYVIIFNLLSLGLTAQSYEEALESYKIGDLQGSIAIIRKIHDEGRNNFDTHLLAGYIYSDLEDYKSARSHWEKCIKLNRSNQAFRADFIKLHLKFKKFKDGLSLSYATTEEFPESKEILYLHSLMLYHSSKLKGALTTIERAKAIDSKDIRLHLLEAKIYIQQESFDKSEIALKWAEALSPKSPEVLNDLAIYHERMFQYFRKINKLEKARASIKESKTYISKAMQVAPTNPVIEKNSKRIENWEI
jgi:tetratricopeptide (TPR) repeat protein